MLSIALFLVTLGAGIAALAFASIRYDRQHRADLDAHYDALARALGSEVAR